MPTSSREDFVNGLLNTQTNRLTLIESLRPSYDIKQICLVRHPMDQSQSFLRLQIWQKYGESEFNLLLRSMRLFAEYASKIGFIRYEDFVGDHAEKLGNACQNLAFLMTKITHKTGNTIKKLPGT